MAIDCSSTFAKLPTSAHEHVELLLAEGLMHILKSYTLTI